MSEEQESVQSEIDTMLKSFDGGLGEPAEVKEPEPEPKPEPEVKEPEPEVKEVVEPEPKEPEPEVKEPEPEKKAVEPEPKPEPDERDKEIADLRAKLAEREAEPKPKEPEVEKPPTEKPLTLEEQDFLGDLDPDELARDPKAFNALLNKVRQTTVADVHKALGEGVLRSIPEIVRANVTIMTDLQKAKDKFYEDNQDLVPFNKVVAVVFEELAAENPDKKFDELVNDVAPEVRKRLGLTKKPPSSEGKKPEPHKLPRKGSGAGRIQDKPPVDSLQSELEEMNKSLGR